MYLVITAWLYVVVMMAVVEATSTNGSVLGAIVTLLLYGVGPIALVVYLMGSPFRRKAIKTREAAEFAAQQAAAAAAPGQSLQPDAGRETSADAVAPVGKEP